MSWRPRFWLTRAVMSDGRAADAEGWAVGFEWLGLTAEISLCRRETAK